MKYLVGLLWLLTIAVAFRLGIGLHQPSAPLQFEEPNAQVNQQYDSPKSDSFFSFLGDDEDHQKSDRTEIETSRQQKATQQTGNTYQPPVGLEDTVQEVSRLLLNSSAMNMSKLARAYNLVQQLEQADLLTAIEQLDPNTTDPKQVKLLSLFLSRYAELDPREAITYVDNNINAKTTKKYGYSTVLTAWAETDPISALDWFKNNANADLVNERNSGLAGIFDGLAQQDLNLAMDNLDQFLDNPRSISSAVSGLAYSLSSEQDFNRLLDKTKDLDNHRLTQTVVSMWARKSPEQALSWVTSVDDNKQQSELEKKLYRTWLYTDPDTAAERYMASADSSNIQSRAKLVVRSLSYQSPEKAMNWINQQSDIDSQPLLADLVKRSTYRNPDFAAKHLNLLKDKNDIVAKSVSIYMSFERSSQTKADDFLAASDYKDEVSQAIAKRQESQNKRRKRN